MKPLMPGATIGVLGGGQLGRMMAVTARQMGYRIVVLDPSARCPTAQVSDGVVVGALDDRHSRGRPARPDARRRRGAARLQVPYL